MTRPPRSPHADHLHSVLDVVEAELRVIGQADRHELDQARVLLRCVQRVGRTPMQMRRVA